jgi:hypothetical protein
MEGRSAMAAKFMRRFSLLRLSGSCLPASRGLAKNEAGELVCVRQTVELAFTTAGLAVILSGYLPRLRQPVRMIRERCSWPMRWMSDRSFLEERANCRSIWMINCPNPAIEEFFAESGFGIRSARWVILYETDGTITNVVLRNSSGYPALTKP